MACITEAASGFPNASGVIPPENGQLQQILGERGWNTYMVGKWHLCPEAEMNLASTRRNWPTGRGFERFYGFLGAETNQWYPELVYDSHPVEPPRTPEEGYHFSVDITDKALEFIRDAKVIAPEKPFFLYYAPGAATRRTTRPKEWSDRFKGRFDMGYEAMREQTLARQKEMGIVPPDTELPPLNPIGTPETRTGPNGEPFPPLDYTRPWGSLSAEEQRLFCRMAEVYAGFLAHADDQIGRLLDYLEESGQRENTMVIVVSDNGASGEGGPNGSVNENSFFNGIPDDIQENLSKIDELGGPKHLQPLPQRLGHGVQHAVQDVEALRVQRRHDRTRASSPGRKASRPRASSASSTTTRSTWSQPFSTRWASTRPRRIAGHVQSHFDGVSMRYSFDAGPLPTARQTQFYSMLGSRSIWHDGWTAVTTHPTISGWGNFGKDTWELYHTDVDRSEAARPRRRGARAPPGHNQPVVRRGRPQRRVPARRPLRPGDHPHAAAGALARAQPLRLLPRPGRRSGVPGGQHPQPLLRDRRAGRHPRPGAQGVLFAHGARFGGHALYVKDNRLHYVYNCVGSLEQKIVADRTAHRREP